MAIDPTGVDIKRFIAEDDGNAVTMLNLLRFNPDGGLDLYKRYAIAIAPFLKKVGAEIVYLGEMSTALVAAEETWDAVLLVRYPSREAFLDMVFDDDYQQITALRTDALEQAVLQATTTWEPGG